MRFKIDLTSLIVGSKCAVFAMFYFVFEGNFPSTSPPPPPLYFEGRFRAYIWRSLYMEALIFVILRYTCINFRESVTWQVFQKM